MKKVIFIMILIFSLFGINFLCGCNQAAKESGVSTAGTNKGTITGYVYEEPNYIYIESMSKLLSKSKSLSRSQSKSKSLSSSRPQLHSIIPLQKISSLTGLPGATVMIGSFISTTDANGAYTFTGIPPGEATITAFKDSYQTTTIVVNSDSVNFTLLRQTKTTIPQGIATIIGTCEGLPGGISPDDMYISAYSTKQYSEESSYDPVTHIYYLQHAPDDGETYVIAAYYPSDIAYLAYGRIDMSGGGIKNLNLDFNSITTVEGSVTVPSGFSPDYISFNLYNPDFVPDYYLLFNDAGWLTDCNFDPGDNSYHVELPQLLSGDAFALYTYATGDKCYLVKGVTNFTGTSKNFDLSSLKVPYLKAPSPDHWADLNGVLPTFAWESAGSNKVYHVYLRGLNDHIPIWECYTKNTSIAFPSNIIGSGTLSPDVDYEWTVSAMSYDNFDMSDMTSLKNARLNSISGINRRVFTF